MEIPGGRIVSGAIRTDTILSDYVLTARLDELRQRRMLLRLLRDDVDVAAGGLTAGDLTGSWRSAAQRGYDRQRSELAGELRRAAGLLDAALTEVVASIDQVGAALAQARAPGRVSAGVPR
jgi:predicted DNA repair protein MutK